MRKYRAFDSAALGFWVNTGSRNETPQEAGISHLIEHMLFKGTNKRSARQIAEAIESLGGRLNAFTSKEYTCFYARVLDEHLDIAVDVLADMFFSSLFRIEDIEREKGVVMEEIRLYEDTPDEIIHDLFAQAIWENHPLGRPVIGTMDSVGRITRDELIDYYRRRYRPDNTVLALAGNISSASAVRMLKPLFESEKAGVATEPGQPPEAGANCKSISKALEQVHVCMGVPGLSQHDDRIYTQHIINMILGGGSSSRLFQKIREERGLVYAIYSYFAAFQDTGLFTIYSGTNPENLDKVLGLIWSELELLVKDGVTLEELAMTKEQIKGNLLLASESVTHRMHRLGKSELVYNRLITTEEILEKMSAITISDVRSLARELLAPERFSIVMLGAVKDGTAALPWLRDQKNRESCQQPQG